MPAIITEMIKQVVLVVLLAVFVEMLLPSGDLSRFVRLVMGLFVVGAVLGAMLQVFPRLVPASADLNSPFEVEAMGDIRRQVDSLQDYQNEQTLNWYKNGLQQQIWSRVSGETGLTVTRVEVELENPAAGQDMGKLKQIKVWIRSGDQPVPAEVLETTAGKLAAEFGLPRELVQISPAD